MRKLILIKHAAPLVIPGTPSEEWKLSDKGRESCGPLAELVREFQPGVIVTSEEPKAAETGAILAEKLGIPCESGEGLGEHDRTNVPHMRSGEFISHVELLFRRPDERVLGRESADEALTRFEGAIEEVLSKHNRGDVGGNLAIVSHGTVIALFVAENGGGNGFELWRRMGLPSVVVMTVPEMRVEQVVERI